MLNLLTRAMNLAGACWMRRSLDEPISALLLTENQALVAGGWNGRLAKWNASGDLQWSVKLPDRIGSISADENRVYVTAGLHLCAVNSTDGNVIWQQPLEGSADIVTVSDGQVYATSSVYDIEHNDFIDSAIWCFDLSGIQTWAIHMAERPWTLNQHNSILHLGLGRPKMGFAVISSSGEISHQNLKSNAPVTTSANLGGEIIFAHANGDITNRDEKLFSGDGESINAIIGLKDRILAATNKKITLLDLDYQQVTQIAPGDITAVSKGLRIDGSLTYWCGIQDSSRGLLKILSLVDGRELASMQSAKITVITENFDRIVVGDEAGEVYVWEEAMLNRRFMSGESESDDDHRQQMREKLKALRKGEL